MGGAGLVFDNLGLNLLSIVGKAPRPSILFLNREHGEEVLGGRLRVAALLGEAARRGDRLL